MRIYILGYFRYNLGDDLFLKILAERYPNIFFKTVALNGYHKLKFPNVKYINSKLERFVNTITLNKKSLVRREVRKSDFVTIIGGSMFIEIPSFDYENNIYDEIKKKNYAILGSNFGPFYSQKFYEYFLRFFSKAKDICFRDYLSYEKFKELNNTRYASDIIFSLDKNIEIKEENKSAIISVINCEKKGLKEYQETYENKIIELIRFLDSNGYTISLMSFCRKEGDEKAIRSIIKKLSSIKLNKSIRKYYYRGEIESALKLLKKSSVIIGSRFHANIIGLVYGKTVIPIAYSDKTINAFKDMAFEGKIFDIRDEKNFNISSLTKKDLEYKFDCYKECQNADSQFLYLDNIFNNNIKDEILNVLSKREVDKNLDQFDLDYKKGILSKSAYFNLIIKKNIDEKQRDNLKNIFCIAPQKIKTSKKISIIIPTYKRHDLLILCIESILHQTYQNIEIIIVNDNPNDGTREIIRKRFNDKRIFYYENEKNSGAGFSRKQGYEKSTGDYIIFCDDDEYIDDNFFEESIKVFENNDINIICSSSYVYYEKENNYSLTVLNFDSLLSTWEYLEKFQIEYIKPNSTFTAIFKKSSLEKANFQEMEMVNDSSIYMRGLINKGLVYVNNNIIGLYRIHEKNITYNIKADFLIENLIEKKKIYDIICQNKIFQNPDKWLKKQIKLTLDYYFGNSNPDFRSSKKVIDWVVNNSDYNQLYLILSNLKFKIKRIIKRIIRR